MLFGYPVEATQNNWLHDCLCETVRKLHARADAGKRYPAWPKILPKAYRVKLESRTGLRDRVKAYDRAIRKISKADRDAILQAVEAENRISDLLSGACDCATIDNLPEVVREPADALFAFAFDLLTDLDVRDQQYAAIYASASEHMCPFCGTEYFDAPGTAREALDHYLTRSRYPFAAANLRNLVPMGHKCNSSYKLASDLLRRADGTRRVAFDPYDHLNLSVSLDDSEPFDGASTNTPRWEIRFEPENPAVSTWDEVFSVRERYRRDHLDPWYENWIRGFVAWARRRNWHSLADAELGAALGEYAEFWAANGLSDRAFLKAAVFRMLRRHCESGHRRLLDQIRNLVMPLAPALIVSTASPSATEGGGSP